jgi:septal ring factor EnvC (AmiA/AmiB activator)
MAENQENQLDCTPGCREVEVPIELELKALNALRAIKSRVREIKKEIANVTEKRGRDKDEEIRSLHEQLATLKQDWNRWDEKRKEAAKIRMIMLGHEEPT